MRKYFLHILFIFFALRVGAQTYNFQNYNVDEGLTQSQVFCVFQDSKGYMWFGTSGGGSSKFDGKKFQNFTPSNGALSNTVYSIVEDKDHYLYFATYDGLQITGKFKDIRIDTNKGLPSNTVNYLLVDKSDKVWLATEKGICYLDENKKPIKLKAIK